MILGKAPQYLEKGFDTRGFESNLPAVELFWV
mgnify:CR=1 FL=1